MQRRLDALLAGHCGCQEVLTLSRLLVACRRGGGRLFLAAVTPASLCLSRTTERAWWLWLLKVPREEPPQGPAPGRPLPWLLCAGWGMGPGRSPGQKRPHLCLRTLRVFSCLWTRQAQVVEGGEGSLLWTRYRPCLRSAHRQPRHPALVTSPGALYVTLLFRFCTLSAATAHQKCCHTVFPGCGTPR